MTHRCHWPGCEVEVEPKFWGCWPHWRSLPKRLQARIWATYRRGQEVTKTPSAEYIAAAKDVQAWIAEQIKCTQARARNQSRRAQMVNHPQGSTIAALLCPYCGEECDGMTIQNSQPVCCGFGCEHCCEVDRGDDESREGT